MGEDYNFHNLSPTKFEDLAASTLAEEYNVSFHTYSTGRDRGIDATALINGKKAVVQVKHSNDVTKQLTEGEANIIFKGEKEKVRKLVQDNELDIYFLVTNFTHPAGQSLRLRQLFESCGAKEVHIYGKEDLIRLINMTPKLKQRFKELYRVGDLTQNVRSAEQSDAVAQFYEKRELDSFVETVALSEAKKKLEKEKLVFITGPRGSGKTTILKQLATHGDFRDKYQLHIITETSNFGDQWSPNQQHLFVIDDIFGSSAFNINETEQWNKLSDKISSAIENNSLFVVTSSSNIFEEAKSYMASPLLSRLQTSTLNLSEKKYQLTRNEKGEVLRKHIEKGNNSSKEKEDLLKDDVLDRAADIVCPCFPLVASKLGSRECCEDMMKQLSTTVIDHKYLDAFFAKVSSETLEEKRSAKPAVSYLMWKTVYPNCFHLLLWFL